MTNKDKKVIIDGIALNSLSDKLKFVGNILIANGFNPLNISLYITQIMLESAWLTSPHAVLENNLSGIKLATSKSARDFQTKLGVTPGRKAGYNEGNYHAKYPNLNSWAKDYKRILSFGAKPIDSVGPNDFINKLYQNKYFTAAGLINYKRGFTDTLKGIEKALINIPNLKQNNNKTGLLAILISAFFFFYFKK